MKSFPLEMAMILAATSETVPRKLVQGTICLPVAVEGYEDVTLTLKKIKS